MFKKLIILSSLSFITLNVYATCQTGTFIPYDLNALKSDTELYYKTAHGFVITNDTTKTQFYRLCKRTILDNGSAKYFVAEECVDQKVKPGKTYNQKQKLYTYAYFTHKGQNVDIHTYTSISGVCHDKSEAHGKLMVV
jgi:hypothetical protein